MVSLGPAATAQLVRSIESLYLPRLPELQPAFSPDYPGFPCMSMFEKHGLISPNVSNPNRETLHASVNPTSVALGSELGTH